MVVLSASHAGVAVRFDTGAEILEQIPKPCLPLKVDYANDFPSVSLYEPDRLKLARTTSAQKLMRGSTKRERRLIAVGRSGIIQMPKTMIDGVVLGLRTPIQIESEVRQWLTEAGREIELLRVQHRANSFVLEVVPA